MTNPNTHLGQAIELMAREEARTYRDAPSSTGATGATSASEARVARAAAPSKREVDAIYDDLIARLADTLATLSSDDVDTTPRSFRASALRPRARS